MIHVQPTQLNHYSVSLSNAEEEIIVKAALLNQLTRREVLELMFLKCFAVQDQVNKLMQDRALKG